MWLAACTIPGFRMLLHNLHAGLLLTLMACVVVANCLELDMGRLGAILVEGRLKPPRLSCGCREFRNMFLAMMRGLDNT